MALTILDNQSVELLDCADDGEAMPVLAGYLENVTNRDATMSNIIHTSSLCTTGEPAQVSGWILSVFCSVQDVTIKILQLGTPKVITVMVLKIAQFGYTMQ